MEKQLETSLLNLEMRISDNGHCAVILLIDFNKKEYDVFKTYEDRTFTSKEIMKYLPLIEKAKSEAERYLFSSQPVSTFQVSEIQNSEACAVTIEASRPEAVHSPKTLKSKSCIICGSFFQPNSNRQMKCEKCKDSKL